MHHYFNGGYRGRTPTVLGYTCVAHNSRVDCQRDASVVVFVANH